MASCESCKKSISPDEMFVQEMADGGKVLVGDCCRGKRMDPQFHYHLEFSSTAGFVATAEYQGLRVEFRKSPEQMQQYYTKYVGGETYNDRH